MMKKLFYEQMLLLEEYYKNSLELWMKYPGQLSREEAGHATLADSMLGAVNTFHTLCRNVFFNGEYLLAAEGAEKEYGEFLLAYRRCTDFYFQMTEMLSESQGQEGEQGSELLLGQAGLEARFVDSSVSLWEKYAGSLPDRREVRQACKVITEQFRHADSSFFLSLTSIDSDVYAEMCALHRDSIDKFNLMANSYISKMDMI